MIHWRSRSIKRIATSTLAGEALAVSDLIGDIIYTKAVLQEIFGDSVSNVPSHIFTDSKNLDKSISSFKMVDDRRLRTELAYIKEVLDKGEIQDLSWISGHQMLANCLTKRGASADSLLKVLRSGYI